MDIFFTCRNTSPWNYRDPARIVYFGPDFTSALNAVDRNWQRYQTDWEEFKKIAQYQHVYSALPENVDWEMVRFFVSGAWWYSIVKVQLSLTSDPKAAEPSHKHTMPFRP